MNMIELIMGILIHPLTALVVCIVLGAIAVSGKFSQHAANVFLAIAAVVGGIGIVRSGLKDPRLITMFVCGLIIVVCGVSYWVKPHAKDAAQNPSPPPVPAAPSNTSPPVKDHPAPAHKTTPAQHAAQYPPLALQAYRVGLGNMPERSRVTNTWNGQPWDESDFADVRLKITNNIGLALQDIDLDITFTEDDPEAGIAGIGQLTDISGIEFRKTPLNMPEPAFKLRGTDGKSYNLPLNPFMEEHRVVRDYRMFCPRLAQRDIIRLIIAAICLNHPKKPPSRLKITGTYVTESSAGRMTVQVNEVVMVTQ
jgi:hypothetical protein